MSSRRIDFGGRDWAAHVQDHWLEFAGNPNLPDYLRCVFVAFGRHAGNGHAKLDQGELSHFLVRKDGMLPDRRDIRASIQKAITLGYLRPESRVLCLVVSSDHVQGGLGDPGKRCNRNHTMRAKDGSGSRRSGRKDGTQGGPFNPKDGSGSRPLTLVPSLSSTDPTDTRQEPA